MKYLQFRDSYLIILAAAVGCAAVPALAQVASQPARKVDLSSVHPMDRITAPIDDRATVERPGNRPPLARPEFDLGSAPPERRLERMILLLEPDSGQQQALENLLAAQHDPQSPQYQQWLTPEIFGLHFGASDHDIDQITAWLSSHGFDVEPVPASRHTITFSGTVQEVGDAFHTEIHIYDINGQRHYANASDPQIPAALAPVVYGIVSLNDFHSAPQHLGVERRQRAAPAFTSGSTHYVTPADFATIYDVAALYDASTDGTGQSIAVAGRTNINVSDVATFRSTFGLPANNPTIIVNGANPGIVSSDEQTEANLGNYLLD